MSRGLNKIMVIGHLGRDPEMRYTPAGKPIATFSVAVNRNWESSDGTRHNPNRMV
jgi:single-strand DNA-binding protein